MKVKVQRRSAQGSTLLHSFLLGAAPDTLGVPGYTRLIDSPDVLSAIGGLADIVSTATIRLMRNTDAGNVRVRNALSRFVDIGPWTHGSRRDLVAWIITTMLTSSNGSAFLLPHTSGSLLTNLEPMPGAYELSTDNGQTYQVTWRGQTYDSTEVLHFRRWVDPSTPWKGLGLRIGLHDLANSLRQEGATKKGFMSDKWKPSIIVKVDALADGFADEAGRQRLVDQYLSSGQAGAPWIIPADLMDVQQVKPLSLTDLAIKDGMEMDKRAVASLVGVTPYMVGVGPYSDAEHNHMIRTTAATLAQIVCQELTRKLLISDELYFAPSTRRLYSYSTQQIATVAVELYDHGLMTGNEARDWVELEPMDDLDELVILENYIPRNKIGDQQKLAQEGGTNGD